MASWEETKNNVIGWSAYLLPHIEKETGILPDYDYFKPSGDSFFLRVPFRYSNRDSKPGLVLYKNRFESWFYSHLKSKDTDSKEFGLGKLVFSLIHDLFHIPQFEPLLKKKALINNYVYKYFTHLNWVEGLAQLYSFKIGNQLYRETRDEDFSQLDERKVEDFITFSLKERKYKHSLAKEIARLLFRDTEQLRKKNFIDKNQVSYSNYPFEIHPDINEMVMEYLDLGYKDKHRRRGWRNKPYIVGAYLLNKLMSRDNFLLKDLMENPFSDKELYLACKEE